MSPNQHRRKNLLRTVATLSLGATAIAGRARSAAPSPSDSLATAYDLPPDYINLENGYYGIMPTPVAEDFKRNIDYLNRHSSRFLRREFDRDGIEAIRAQLARHAGVSTGEIAITRGATESLQNLITNYRHVGAGDTVMYGNLDYDAMQYAMNDFAQRRSATVAVVQVPEPATRQNASTPAPSTPPPS